jgi:hypothetical protein
MAEDLYGEIRTLPQLIRPDTGKQFVLFPPIGRCFGLAITSVSKAFDGNGISVPRAPQLPVRHVEFDVVEKINLRLGVEHAGQFRGVRKKFGVT